MLFMVIERFRDNDMVPIYQRLRESGRSLPDGLEYVDSWIEPNFGRCFQLMRCDDPKLSHCAPALKKPWNPEPSGGRVGRINQQSGRNGRCPTPQSCRRILAS